MEDYLYDVDKKQLKNKAFQLLKQDYIISILHTVCGEILLEKQIKNIQETSYSNKMYMYQKELDRELDEKVKNIIEAQHILAKDLDNKRFYEDFLNTLGLPQKVCTEYLPFVKEFSNPDLFYVFAPESKGSRIITEKQYKEQLILEEFLHSST